MTRIKHNITVPEGYSLRAFSMVESTNKIAQDLVGMSDHPDGPFWIVADQQSGGKGSRGRQWQSLPGNLFCSLLYPLHDCDKRDLSQLSFVTAVAVRDTLFALCAGDNITANLQCKWPNDILLNGAKIAGILLETVSSKTNDISHMVIGIGVNIVAHPEQVLYQATHLNQFIENIARHRVLETLMIKMDMYLKLWINEGFDPIRTVWLAHGAFIGQTITVKMMNETVRGRFMSLDDDGALVLDHQGQRRLIRSGDVFNFDE